ncbi:hypothetical protein GLYMA_11G001366v4 [Glycine max]|nr:hypothetical protein GLYMA_11G001366v4 [Glycine max]KAH1156840.1 hypothetical protein GYH30_029583 [Glycine max]
MFLFHAVLSPFLLHDLSVSLFHVISSHSLVPLLLHCFLLQVSTLAGEVEDPSKTFHKALVGGLVLVVSSYLIPFLAVTGALRVCSKLK